MGGITELSKRGIRRLVFAGWKKGGVLERGADFEVWEGKRECGGADQRFNL